MYPIDSDNQKQELLTAAIQYSGLGWSVVPAVPRTKKPVGKWKGFQRNPADLHQLAVWFKDVDAERLGIAIICGEVSGGLVVRDFDSPGSYDAWASANPDLASRCPTVKTGREGGHGRHVFAICKGLRTKALPDGGHLRGEGSYVMAPPSFHELGQQYEWLIVPWSQPLPVVEPEVFLTIGQCHTIRTCESVRPSVPSPGSPNLFSARERSLREIATRQFPNNTLDRIAMAIKKTLPAGPGERNRCIFRLARELKAIEEVAGLTGMELEFVIQQWHRLALPYVRTKDFDESLADFLWTWSHRLVPAGAGLADAVNRASLAPIPERAKKFHRPELRKLCGICRELQKIVGDGWFYLSSHQAAAAIGLTGDGAAKQAWRWLGLLRDAGLVQAGEKGTPGRRGPGALANQYRWVGGE